METTNAIQLQKNLFKHIIVCCGELSAIPILCDLLHVNKSSIYARVRGDKLLRIEELLMLAKKFEFSIDPYVFQETRSIKFQFNFLQTSVGSCHDYLASTLESFSLFSHVPALRVWFLVNSLPFFQMMNFRELALFKSFAYARVNWQLPYTERLIFHPDTFPEREVYHKFMKPILNYYTNIETLEFWPDDLYQTTLKQIQYFQVSGQIIDPTVIAILIEQLDSLCDHQYEMAKAGRKFIHKDKIGSGGAKFELYHNEIAPSNITMLAESESLSGVFTVYDDPNFMFSDDPNLYRYTLAWMRKLKSKCVRISEDSEQNRKAYFNRIHNEIRNLKS